MYLEPRELVVLALMALASAGVARLPGAELSGTQALPAAVARTAAL